MINGAPSDGKAAQNLTQTLFSGEWVVGLFEIPAS
jgi:hypothetical protein